VSKQVLQVCLSLGRFGQCSDISGEFAHLVKEGAIKLFGVKEMK
jgi:hypothetical protein